MIISPPTKIKNRIKENHEVKINFFIIKVINKVCRTTNNIKRIGELSLITAIELKINISFISHRIIKE